MAKTQPAAQEQQLILKMLELSDDPLAFVMFAFPWGVPGGPLENFEKPREWQIQALTEIRDHSQP